MTRRELLLATAAVVLGPRRGEAATAPSPFGDAAPAAPASNSWGASGSTTTPG